MSEENDLVVQGQTKPAELLLAAIEKGAGIEVLKGFMDLQERHELNEARKAYHVAMAAFKKNPPVIVKNKEVKYGQTSYKHAGLAEAAASIGKALSAQGLSAAWRIDQKDKEVTVTCEITHILGHTESTSLTAPSDTSGSKNAIQAIASTVSYLQRYSLLSLTGLAAQDVDDDGVGSEEQPRIAEAEAAELAHLIEETGADMAAFCKHFKVDTLESMFASDYKRAVSQLEAKKKRAK